MTNPATLSCFVGFALFASGGCAAGPPPSSAASVPPPPSSAVSVRPPPSSTASVPPLPRAQPTPPAAAKELAGLFTDVCQMVSLPNAAPGLPSFGCACCAPFDGCKPSDPPADAEAQVYFPSAASSGSFTRAGAEQRAMPMDGCEPHSENYGGLLLLERQGQSFAFARYISGLNASRCWSVRRDDGRDALLCEHDDVHQGTAQQALFLLDLAQTDEQLLAYGALLSVTDDEMSGCWSDKGTPVSSVQMRPPQLSGPAGRTELTVELDVRQGRVTAPYLARCKALERAADDAAARPDPAQRPRLLLAAKTERLLFRFDGSKFVRNGVTARSGR